MKSLKALGFDCQTTNIRQTGTPVQMIANPMPAHNTNHEISNNTFRITPLLTNIQTKTKNNNNDYNKIR